MTSSEARPRPACCSANSPEGESVAGVYRQRLDLATEHFAILIGGMGFELAPWKPQLERHLGQTVSGTLTPGGGIDWTLGRKRGLGI